MNLPKRVTVCEVGARDGLQKAPLLSTEEKVKLINMVTDAGYQMIEIGTVASGCFAYAQAYNTIDVFKAIEKRPGVIYRVLVNDAESIYQCANANVEYVKISLSASEAHNRAEMQMSTRESVETLKDSGAALRATGLKMMGSISMPFVCPWSGNISLDVVRHIIEAYMEAGATMISLADTSGMADPAMIYERIMQLNDLYPKMKWIAHFHNTRGLGLANVVAAMQAGITDIDSSFAGTGGCPFIKGAKGNISSEDLLYMLARMGIETGIDYEKALALGKYVQDTIDVATDSYQLDLMKNGETLTR